MEAHQQGSAAAKLLRGPRVSIAMRWCALLLMASLAQADDIDRLVEQLKSSDLAVRCEALKAAKEQGEPRLLSPLLGCLKDSSADVRTAAAQALGARVVDDDRKKASAALAARLPALSRKETEDPELMACLQSLHDLAQPNAIDALMDDITVDTPKAVARARLMAVGNIPDPKAIDELIAFVAKGRRRGDEGHRVLAHQALLYATGEKRGHDPDGWRSWWKSARDSFDFKAAAERRAEERRKEQERQKRREERRQKGKPPSEDGGEE